MDENNNYELKHIKIFSQFGKKEEYIITDMVTEFNIYEDIFDHSITASVLILDTIGIISAFPIMGGETVELSYKTRNSVDFKTKEFVVYIIEDRLLINDSSQKFTLRMVTKESWLNMGFVLSQSFSGNYNDIIKQILTTNLSSTKEMDFESGMNIGDFIAPNWDCFKTINWILTRMVGQDGVSPFLFFENMTGYNLKPLSTLYNQTNIKELTYIPLNLPNTEYNNVVEEYKYGDLYDQTKNKMGVFAQSLITFDQLNKEINIDNYDYTDISVKLDKHRQFNTLYESGGNRTIQLKKADNSHISSFKRYSLLSTIDTIPMDIILNGDSDILVGDLVDFIVPRLQKDTEDGTEPYISGKFLVARIRHTLNRDEYITTANIIKDSINRDPEQLNEE